MCVCVCVQVESSESEGEEESGEEEQGDEEEEEEGEGEEEEEVLPSHSLRSRRRGGGRRRSHRLQKKAQLQTRRPPQQRGKKSAAKPAPKARKRLRMEQPRPLPPSSRAEAVVSAIIELRCSRAGRGGGMVSREQRGLEMQLCEALWEEVSGQDSSWPFAEPLKKKEVSLFCDLLFSSLPPFSPVPRLSQGGG